jgi:hypothetical protein
LLLLNYRLNIRNLLRRKRFNIPSTNCMLCSHIEEETLHHLFFGCEFAQSCWTTLHIVWDLSLSVVSMMEHQRNQFSHDCLMEVLILATWSIWLYRNNIIFNSAQISLSRWRSEFHDIFLLCKHRAKPSLDASLTSWMSSL